MGKNFVGKNFCGKILRENFRGKNFGGKIFWGQKFGRSCTRHIVQTVLCIRADTVESCDNLRYRVKIESLFSFQSIIFNTSTKICNVKKHVDLSQRPAYLIRDEVRCRMC